MTRKTVFVLALILGLAAFETALACSCAPPPPPQQAHDHADAVFSAKVLEAPEAPRNYSLRLQVDDSWKGADCRELEIGAGFATCIGNFEKGKTYLIYAYRTEEGGLRTDLCTRTRSIEDAAEDLAALGKPEKSCG
jgi:hypothetical protein